MQKATVGLWLAGLAAAGAALIAARTPSAAPAHDARLAQLACSPGAVGSARRLTYNLKVAGKPVSEKAVKKGDWVRTDESGAAVVCLKQGDLKCRIGPDSIVQIQPPKKKKVLLRVTRTDGGVSCKASSGGTRNIETPGETIMLGDPRLGFMVSASERALARADGTFATGSGNLFSLVVGKNRTLVKVRRGSAVVAKGADRRTAVVLGRRQQVVVPAGRDPETPAAIALTAAEQTVFNQLERSLPKDTDKTPPPAALTGPADPSSVRSASFTFSSEPGVTFSCALDDMDFRFCTSPQSYENLASGRHTFAVRAIDASGNTASRAYPWLIGLIAFASERDGTSEIYVVDRNGQGPLRVTDNQSVDAAPAWSPDRRRLAFHSDRGGNWDVYVISAEGGAATRITVNPAVDRNPSWSPDGRRLAFESERDGNREIYVSNADGTGETRLTTGRAEDFDPGWSPDGTRIAFASTRDGNYEIYVMAADGSGQTRLTNDPTVEFNPAWSPDGRRIAFHSQRSGISMNIYVMNADGSGVIRLTETAFDDYNPAWSPDGAEITFQSTRDENPRPKSEIYRMKADGSEETRLTNSLGEDIVPDW